MQEKIIAGIKNAMLQKDTVRLNTLRAIKTAITNELVATGQKPQETLADDKVLAVIRRLVKQHKDSIEQFTAGGRNDLVTDEAAELKILNEFLPQQMSEAEIRQVAEAKKAELNITDKSGLGKFVGILMKELRDKADGAEVKKVAESLFE